MKKALITGSEGFIGKNLCAHLEQNKDWELLRFTRNDDKEKLKELVEAADFVFHLAGVNRPKDADEFKTENQELTETIVALLEEKQGSTPLLITSSSQAELDNPYGVSKRAAEHAVFDWAKRTGNQAYVYRLPNVFGKWCKPNYNSVVATFCHNIANGLDITINDPKAALRLVYVDDVIDDFLDALAGTKESGQDGFCHITREFTCTLSELADKLYLLRDMRKSLVVPDFVDIFERFLYATFTSYMLEDGFDYALDMKEDQRGWLAEFIKSPHSGQVFASQTKPGFVRGNHWHHTKIEKFLVLSGEGEVIFKKLHADTSFSYKVSGKELRVVDIPVGYIHTLKNVGKEDLITLIWADEILDQERPDTYYPEAI